MMDKSAFADRIAKLRVAKGLSQHQLSQMLGVKRSVVSYYESGDRLPSYDVLIEMSRVFNVSMDYLLKGKDASRVIQVSDLSEKELDVIMGVINSMQIFTQGYIMTKGGPNNNSLFYVLLLYKRAFEQTTMGIACAMAWILFVILGILTAVNFAISGKWVYYGGE